MIIYSVFVQNGLSFNEAVFNETVQVIELDEGLDGETVFLYIFLAACVILTLVGGQQLLSSFGRKSRSSARKQTVEVGTSNPNNVDYDWLPSETVRMLSKYKHCHEILKKSFEKYVTCYYNLLYRQISQNSSTKSKAKKSQEVCWL